MSKNLTSAIVIIIVILGVAFLFWQQQKNLKNPFEITPNLTSTTPTQNPTPTPILLTPTPIIPTSQSGSKSANITTMPNGLVIQDLIVGTGQEAKAGDSVTVNYLGTLANGTKFDSSYDRNQPFTTQIGVGSVIKGWDEGIPGMKIGGKRKLIIPPNLGYGAQGAGTIPPNSTLIFEVELLGIK